MAEKRDVKYLNRDFDSFKSELVEFSKTYFPTTYTDFTPASTGMLFMEMASYVGDVLSFYLDNQVQETFIQYARQTENLYNLAYLLGYSPKVTTAATVEVEVFQTVPAETDPSTGDEVPDYDYALQIAENTAITSTSNSSITFLMQDKIDFSYSNALDPTTVTIYETSGTTPTSYLLKKTRKAISATINSTTFTFGSPQRFQTVDLTANNIIGILDITDSDGNVWYEVPHLAQETIYDNIRNTNTNDPNYYTDTDVPYLLKLKKVQRRFASRFLNTTTLQIQFGAGTVADNDEEIMPNPDNVGIGLPFEKDKMTTAYSPTNFVFTDTYGISPSNTTLTVRYLTGGGVSANVPANDLTTINTSGITFINTNPGSDPLSQTTFDSVAVNNPKAAAGGSDGDDINELRQNSLGNFQNQLRTVTQDDYLIRVLSMPSNLGAIAKAYAAPQKLEDLSMGEVPAVVDLYVLGYDSNKYLNTASTALKQNLKTYLSEYRIINDSVKIKDAFIINIAVDFDIIVLPNYNNNEVLQNCIIALQNHFQIDKWQINQPIILKDLYVMLDKVEGVQTIQNIVVKNKTGNSIGYSDYAYDVKGATINNVVYPSIDPMIFELKYPNTDIQGRVVPL